MSPNAGPLGGATTVTVSGSGFQGATAVDFGAVPASSFSVGPGGTTVSAVAPAEAAGVVDVTITTPTGTSLTSSADQYTYASSPEIWGLVASPPGLLPSGGEALLSAHQSNGSQCTWSVSPALAGYPTGGSCTSSDDIEVSLPANSSSSTEYYTVTLSVSGPGGQASASTDVPIGSSNLEATADSTVALSAGSVSTVAGTGRSGQSDGQGTQAGFKSPGAEVVVGGHVYVDDGDAIRKLNPSTGQVSTLAGTPGTSGCSDSSQGSQVTMSEYGLATDGVDLYSLCWSYGYNLRRTDIATGATSTIANVGGGFSGQLAMGPDGALYMFTSSDGIFRVDLQTGDVAQVIGGQSFAGQCVGSIAADGNDLWVTASGYNNSFFGLEDCGTAYWDLYEVPIGVPGAVPVFVASLAGEVGDSALVSAGSYLYADGQFGGSPNSVDVVRVAKATGSLSLVAGSGASGAQDGTGLNAWFGSVAGLASDGTNIWVSDNANYDVREVSAASALPAGLAPTAADTLDLAAGAVSTFAGTGRPGSADGQGTGASFEGPQSEAVVGGYLYVDDGQAIRKVDLSDGQVSTLAGTPGTSGCTDGSDPTLVTMDERALATDGVALYSLCFSNNGSYLLRRTDIATGATATLANLGYWWNGQLTVGPGGTVYVTTSQGGGVEAVDPSTGAVTSVLSYSEINGQCTSGIAADAVDLWVVASGYQGSHCATSGAELYEVPLADPSSFRSVSTGLAANVEEVGQGQLVSAGAYLYTDVGLEGLANGADLARISKSDGSLGIVAGSGSSGWKDGTGLDAWFGSVAGLASDGTNIWASDGANYDLREVSGASALPAGLAPTATGTVDMSAGAVSTFAGTGSPGSADGQGTGASFEGPQGEAVVGGYLYVNDGQAIRKVDLADGQVSTFIGTPGASGCTDSTNPALVTMDEHALATDGVALFSLCWGMNNPYYGSYYLRRTDIATGATSTLADLSSAWDGQLTVGPDGTVYVTTSQGNGVEGINPVTGAVTGILSYSETNGKCTSGIAADAEDLWVVASGYQGNYCATSGAQLYQVPLADPSSFRSISNFPSANLWAASSELVSAGAYLYMGVGAGSPPGSVDLARMSKSDGTLSLVAGSGASGFKDGTGLDAWFGSIAGVASDGTNIWVTDGANYDVREVTATSPLPAGLAPTATGTVNLAPGAVSTFAGTGSPGSANGQGTGASFEYPRGEAVVGGSLYVDDQASIRKVNLSSGQVSTLAGAPGSSGCTDSTDPAQVTMDDSGLATDGTALYSLCYSGHSEYLQRTDIATGATSSVSSVGGAQFLTVGPDGTVYFTTGGGDDGMFTYDPATGMEKQYLSQTAFGGTNGWSGQCVYGVAADDNYLWVTASGWYSSFWGEMCGQGSWDLYKVPLGQTSPTPVLVSAFSSGNEVGAYALVSAGDYLYADTTNSRGTSSGPGVVRISKATGATALVAGAPARGLADGLGSVAEFSEVFGLASDGANLWVADTGNYDIRRVFGGPVPPSPTTTLQTQAQLVQLAGGPISDAQMFGGDNEAAACPCATKTLGRHNDVDPGDGSLIEASADLSVPGAGVALGLSRDYDSGLAQQQVADAAGPGPLGYGWSYNLGMSVSVNGSGVATVSQEDGSEVSFSPYVAGSSPSWCLAAANYCADEPRTRATLNQASNGGWAFTRYAGGDETVFGFSATGPLTSITDQAGDQLSASTGAPGSGQCPAGATTCTVWASSASGRSITLAFDATGQMTSAGDNAGSTVSYCYFGQSCAAGASNGGASDLYSASLPGGATTTYGYDSADPTATLDHDIVSEGLPAGGTVANTYDSYGRVSEQVAPQSTVTLSYSGAPSSYQAESAPGGGPAATTVAVTWPQGTSAPGQAVEYQYSDGALVAQATGSEPYQGAAPVFSATQYLDLDPTSAVPTTVQDPDGNATTNTVSGPATAPMSDGDVTLSSDALGNTTQYQYNTANQVWCQVAPAEYLDGVRCPQTASPPASLAAMAAMGGPSYWAGTMVNIYNSADQLLATVSPLGRTTTYSYTPSGLSVPAGLQYCSMGPVAYAHGVTCPAYGQAPAPGTTSSTFDAAGDVTSTTNPVGAMTTMQYTDASHPGLPTVTTGPDGQVSTVVYNAAGQVTSSTVSFGSYSATTLSAYSTAGQLYCTVAPAQVAQGVTCPTSPPSPSSPPGGATSTFYDTDGRVTQQTGPAGGTTVHAYDGAGNQYCSVGPQAYAAGTRCPATPPYSAPSVGNDPYLGATIDTFDAQGQVVQETNPLGGITLSYYDANANLVGQTLEGDGQSTDPPVSTLYTYDADGRQYSQTSAPGTAQFSTTISYYDPDGNVYCSVSADAYAEGPYSGTGNGYQCPAWQPSWASSPPGIGALYSLAPTLAQAAGVTTSFYDADGELAQQSSPDQATTVSVYDADGETVCAEDATDMETTLAAEPGATYPYSCPASPLTSPPATGSGPGCETTIYDAAGNVLSSTDAAGDTTSYTYDPADQVLTTTGPGGAVTTDCYYWQASTCAAGAPPGGGDADQLYSTTLPPAMGEPSGATTAYTYLPGGALATKTTAAGTVTDAYDAAGELRSVTYGTPANGYQGSSDISYTYNPVGEVATMIGGTGETTYNYDDAGDLLSAAFVAASGSGLTSGTTSYTYYSTGQRDALTYPVAPAGGSPTVTDAYNSNGELASITDWAGRTINFTNDPHGNTTTTAYPNSTTVSATYDLGDAMTGLDAQTGAPGDLGTSLAAINYQLDSAEQVKTETDTGALSASVTYGYDNADRLGSVTEGAGTPAAEAYDPSGDPTTLPDGGAQDFNAAGQLTAAQSLGGGTEAYGYNPTGDRTSSTGTIGTSASFAYNQADQLASTTLNGATVSYTYNGEGLLTGRATAAGTVTDTWDITSGTASLLSDATNDYLYGPNGTPVEQADLATGAAEYVVSDAQGSTRLLLGASGTVDATFSFDAYGNLTASSGTATTPLLYDGQELDTATGLYYLRARWYDPGTGEFISVDPDLAETGEPYAYAGDDPVNGGDPSGLCWSLAPGVYGPCLPPPPGVPYDGSFDTQEILQYPQVLKGLNPQQVVDSLAGRPVGPEDAPPGWFVTPGQGTSVAPGWVMRQVTEEGNYTGRLIRWGATVRENHPDEWYWTVTQDNAPNVRVEAGNWPGGPKEYVGNTGGVLPKEESGGGDENPPPPNPCLASSGHGDAVTLDGCVPGEPGGGEPPGEGGEPEPGPEPPPIIEASTFSQAADCVPAFQPLQVQ